MKPVSKILFIGLITATIFWNISPAVSAMEKWPPNDASTDLWNVIDLLIARPLGIGAGILGTGVFILSLPYTLPTGGVNEALNTFIIRPFKFSFTRKCPDEDM